MLSEFRLRVFRVSVAVPPGRLLADGQAVAELNTAQYLAKLSSKSTFCSVRSSRNANVHSFVCPVKVCLELSIFIFLSQVSLTSLLGLSQVSYLLFLSALLAYLIGQTEPKILRLVLFLFRNSVDIFCFLSKYSLLRLYEHPHPPDPHPWLGAGGLLIPGGARG